MPCTERGEDMLAAALTRSRIVLSMRVRSMSRSLANTAPATRTARACGAFTLASSSSKCPQYSRSRVTARSAVGEHLFAHQPERVELGDELRRRGRELREIPGGFVVSGRRIGHALRGELRLVHRDRIAFGLIDDDALIKRHGGGQRLGGAHQRLVLHEQLAHAFARLAGALLSDEIRGNDGERDCGEADRDAQRHAGAISARIALVRHRLLAVCLSCFVD